MESRFISEINGKKNYSNTMSDVMSEQTEDAKIEAPIVEKYKLQTKDVNVFYGDFQAIKDVSMNIKPKSITAFIGPSGCGKSTFLRLFNRMNDYIEDFKMEGKIKIDDTNIYKNKIQLEQLRKEVGMVFQKPNPFPKSIFENVAY